jgi:hypothetical protein
VFYSIYGLGLETDLPLPGLLARQDNQTSDVRIWLSAARHDGPDFHGSESVWYQSSSTQAQEASDASDDASHVSVLTIFKADDGTFRFRYPDGVEFRIDASGAEVRATWPDSSSLEDVALYLTGPLLGFLLRLRGVVALHASVVNVGNRAVAFVGPAGAGKSTTAAAFATLDYRILTEDVAALFELGTVLAIRPGYPHIALWPDSTAMLFGSPHALPPFTPGWDKRCMDLTATGSFADEALPLSAIYLLSCRAGRDLPRILPLSPGDAMMGLLANIYGNRLLHMELRVRELDLVRHLVATVPVRQAVHGAASAALQQWCEVILDDLTRHPQPLS